MINNIDINKIVVSFKFLFGKQDFKYFISYKDSEKIGHLCIFCPLMVTCKRNFDQNRRIYFLTKEEKDFIGYLEKVR